jgi:hypothetical protein
LKYRVMCPESDDEITSNYSDCLGCEPTTPKPEISLKQPRRIVNFFIRNPLGWAPMLFRAYLGARTGKRLVLGWYE